MDFSTMVLTMYVPAGADNAEADERILNIAIEQTLTAAELGFNPWFTEHHFLPGFSHSSAPEIWLSYLAANTQNIRLGHGIVAGRGGRGVD